MGASKAQKDVVVDISGVSPEEFDILEAEFRDAVAEEIDCLAEDVLVVETEMSGVGGTKVFISTSRLLPMEVDALVSEDVGTELMERFREFCPKVTKFIIRKAKHEAIDFDTLVELQQRAANARRSHEEIELLLKNVEKTSTLTTVVETTENRAFVSERTVEETERYAEFDEDVYAEQVTHHRKVVLLNDHQTAHSNDITSQELRPAVSQRPQGMPQGTQGTPRGTASAPPQLPPRVDQASHKGTTPQADASHKEPSGTPKARQPEPPALPPRTPRSTSADTVAVKKPQPPPRHHPQNLDAFLDDLQGRESRAPKDNVSAPPAVVARAPAAPPRVTAADLAVASRASHSAVGMREERPSDTVSDPKKVLEMLRKAIDFKVKRMEDEPDSDDDADAGSEFSSLADSDSDDEGSMGEGDGESGGQSKHKNVILRGLTHLLDVELDESALNYNAEPEINALEAIRLLSETLVADLDDVSSDEEEYIPDTGEMVINALLNTLEIKDVDRVVNYESIADKSYATPRGAGSGDEGDGDGEGAVPADRQVAEIDPETGELLVNEVKGDEDDGKKDGEVFEVKPMTHLLRPTVYRQYSVMFRLLLGTGKEDGPGSALSGGIDADVLQLKLKMPPSKASQMMAEVDKDGNGVLDFREFVYFMQHSDKTAHMAEWLRKVRLHGADYIREHWRASEGELKRFHMLFDLLDADGDGTLELSEIQASSCVDADLEELQHLTDAHAHAPAVDGQEAGAGAQAVKLNFEDFVHMMHLHEIDAEMELAERLEQDEVGIDTNTPHILESLARIREHLGINQFALVFDTVKLIALLDGLAHGLEQTKKGTKDDGEAEGGAGVAESTGGAPLFEPVDDDFLVSAALQRALLVQGHKRINADDLKHILSRHKDCIFLSRRFIHPVHDQGDDVESELDSTPPPPPPLTETLPADELVLYEKAFGILDEDSGGSLDVEELNDALQQMLAKGLHLEELEALFGLLGAVQEKDDHVLTYEDFVKLIYESGDIRIFDNLDTPPVDLDAGDDKEEADTPKRSAIVPEGDAAEGGNKASGPAWGGVRMAEAGDEDSGSEVSDIEEEVRDFNELVVVRPVIPMPKSGRRDPSSAGRQAVKKTWLDRHIIGESSDDDDEAEANAGDEEELDDPSDLDELFAPVGSAVTVDWKEKNRMVEARTEFHLLETPVAPGHFATPLWRERHYVIADRAEYAALNIPAAGTVPDWRLRNLDLNSVSEAAELGVPSNGDGIAPSWKERMWSVNDKAEAAALVQPIPDAIMSNWRLRSQAMFRVFIEDVVDEVRQKMQDDVERELFEVVESREEQQARYASEMIKLAYREPIEIIKSFLEGHHARRLNERRLRQEYWKHHCGGIASALIRGRKDRRAAEAEATGKLLIIVRAARVRAERRRIIEAAEAEKRRLEEKRLKEDLEEQMRLERIERQKHITDRLDASCDIAAHVNCAMGVGPPVPASDASRELQLSARRLESMTAEFRSRIMLEVVGKRNSLSSARRGSLAQSNRGSVGVDGGSASKLRGELVDMDDVGGPVRWRPATPRTEEGQSWRYDQDDEMGEKDDENLDADAILLKHFKLCLPT